MLLFLLFLFSVSFLFSPSAGDGDLLLPSNPLLDGQTLVSAGGNFELGFFSPAGSDHRYVGVWYHRVPIQTVIWVANRRAPVRSRLGSLLISANGTLLIADGNSTVIWSSASSSSFGVSSVLHPVAQLLKNGNFVVREADGRTNFPWQSFDYPTDTMMPDMEFGWKRALGGSSNLTSWTSAMDPAPGIYVTTMNIQGYPEICTDGPSNKPVYRSGPWNGLRLTGVPDMANLSALFQFNYVNNEDEVYFVYHLVDPTIFFHITLNQTGNTQGLVWIPMKGSWSVFSSDPKDRCDFFSACGLNSACNPNDASICSCLQGFVPKNMTNWELRDTVDGCRRKTPLDCQNNTDGFVKVANAKLPETIEATADLTMRLNDCAVKCLSNCSCTAYASANLSSGIGCIFWSGGLDDLKVFASGGQDLYVRLAAADLQVSDSGSGSGFGSKSKGKHISVAIIAAAAAGTAVLLMIIALAALFVAKKRRKYVKRAASSLVSYLEHFGEHEEDGDVDLPLFDFSTIVEATNNFASENKLGQGGFGPVYKAKLGHAQVIAIKRLSKTSLQGIDEFKTELNLIAKLQHRNLVRLLGCCIEGEERLLVYEFMPNKSLDAFLFDKEKGAELDWQKRYNIIVGIARGLLYLHHDSVYRIVHRDLKASNILLDNCMNPKISDFGMARIFGGDETEANNTLKVVGTYGYMSPEYAMDGIFSLKSDVFSYGVLVLEIISGKRNRVYSENHVNLLGHAWSSWIQGDASLLVDKSMGSNYPIDEVLKCIKVALLCVQEHPEHRPTMYSVFVMLGSDGAQIQEPEQPGFAKSKGHCTQTDSETTVNDITITKLHAR